MHADGVWLDGDGPDNGAYQCSGSYSWGKLPAPYPALDADEVDAFCVGENLVQAAAQTIAAFLLTRGAYWFLGVNWVDQLNLTVAALMLTDYGEPLGNMTNSSAFVFKREYTGATVALDCSSFTASFSPR